MFSVSLGFFFLHFFFSLSLSFSYLIFFAFLFSFHLSSVLFLFFAHLCSSRFLKLLLHNSVFSSFHSFSFLLFSSLLPESACVPWRGCVSLFSSILLCSHISFLFSSCRIFSAVLFLSFFFFSNLYLLYFLFSPLLLSLFFYSLRIDSYHVVFFALPFSSSFLFYSLFIPFSLLPPKLRMFLAMFIYPKQVLVVFIYLTALLFVIFTCSFKSSCFAYEESSYQTRR